MKDNHRFIEGRDRRESSSPAMVDGGFCDDEEDGGSAEMISVRKSDLDRMQSQINDLKSIVETMQLNHQDNPLLKA